MNEREFHDRHYEAEAERLLGSALFERVHDRAARQFLQATGVGRAHRLLSLGCGDGSIERRLAPHLGEIVGFDISPVAVRRAKEKCASAGLANVAFYVGDTAALRGGELGQFDVVAAFAVLHHLGEREIGETLAAARQCLGTGGIFYSTDPSRFRMVRLFARFVRATYERYHSPEERELDPAALATLAERAGFARVVIGYSDFFLGPLAWLAPKTPRSLASMLEALDNLALKVPLVRRGASSFSLLARF
ncbi:MAG TPA: class I SAM-dependent methyltransferase [Burkholderiales bacterium]|jgi:SAM-dependent methyltransferase|nr:class I SAM-dependent methyltransferase [Burkholderiales bacterium]